MKKALNIIKNILTLAFVFLAVFMIVFTVITLTSSDKKERSFFGYMLFIVRTDSMSATDFSAGDLVISKKVDVSTLKEGDIITFISHDPESFGETITHKIRSVVTSPDGSLGFVTYGTTTNKNDRALATVVLGKYCGRIPKLGSFFSFMKTAPGYILLVLIPFVLIIAYQFFLCVRLLLQYKRQQEEEIRAEREKLALERAESERRLRELQSLKEMFAKQREMEQKSVAENNAPVKKKESERPAVDRAESERRLRELQALKEMFARQREKEQKSDTGNNISVAEKEGTH